MALKGNLRDFSIIQILNIINLAQKTGALIVEGSGEATKLVFHEGKLAYAMIGQEDGSLGAILYRNNKINHSQARLLKAKAANMTDKQLGLLLINAGYVSQQDIIESIQEYYLSAIRRFFSWVEGSFRFEQNIRPPADKIPIKLDLGNVIIEGFRHLREWEQLHEEIPSLEMAVKFTERPGAELRSLNLSVEEWRVVRYVNPKNTIRQIGRATKLNEVEIRRVVFALLQSGVVEMVRPEGAKVTFADALPNQSKEEQKNILNRLIDRIRAE
jgi:hypothetical protein